MPVLPTDREKRENESTPVTSRSQCTEDSRKHLEMESSLPRVDMDRGFLDHGSDADLATGKMLTQKLHSVAETPQVSHEAPEPHAVSCLLVNLDAKGLGRVLLKGSVGSAAQTFVDTVWVGRGERMMAEKSSKYLHQSSGAGENDVQESGCGVNSKGIVSPWVAGCATRVLHQSEKHRNVRTRSRMRKIRDVSTQDGDTADPGNERGEMATVNPARVTGPSLGRTDANFECPSQKCAASEHWQPGVSSSPISVPRNGRKLALKPMMGHRRKYVSKSFSRRKSVTFGCPEHKGASSRRVSERRKRLGRVIPTETEECIEQTAGTRSADYLRFLAEAEMRAADPDEYLDMDDSDADDFEVILGGSATVSTCPRVHLAENPMTSSAKRACAIPPPVSRIPTQPDIEMGTVVLEDAMEVDFDAGVESALLRRESVRCGRNVLIQPTWKYVQTLLVSAATVTQLKH